MVNFEHLHEWLSWIKFLHCKEVDLGLERVAQVASQLDLLSPDCPVVIVAGTNGKGSCVAGLEAIYLAAGYQVGTYTSPFLFRYNEQVRLQGTAVSDEALCSAFRCIAEAMGNITLTPFEFGTLAALFIFKNADLDLWILEVGLGGRLDAVNILTADVSIIASIALDHTEILGHTRSAIAREKAGILRPQRPAVCGDFDPPESLIKHAKSIKTLLFCQGKQFGFKEKTATVDWWYEQKLLEDLPLPRLALQNISTVLMGVELLQPVLPVRRTAIEGVAKATLPGRIQVIAGEVTRIFDVSHNPAAVELLARYLRNNPVKGKMRAIFSMLADKDILGSLLVVRECIDYWYVAPLSTPRSACMDTLRSSFQDAQINNHVLYSSIHHAHNAALQEATAGDCVITFGSFHTVSEVLHPPNGV